MFAQTEEIIPAPKLNHTISATIQETLKAKEERVSKTILFNLSEHGLVNMASYDKYLSDNLINYTLTEETIAKLRGCKWYITHTGK